ncbi:MAG: hypothetical protein AAF756_10835 [Pseudomonadota bacterium]
MGDIKDLIDLTIELANRTENRQVSEALLEINREVLTLQSETMNALRENADLFRENAGLVKKVAELTATISRLEEDAKEVGDALPALSDEEEKLLLFVAQRERVFASQVAAHLGVEKVKAEYFLDSLIKRNLIHYIVSFNAPENPHFPTPAAREYLAERDLI